MAKKKEDALASLFSSIKFGLGDVLSTFDNEDIPMGRYPTGLPTLDDMMGGGFPIGRINELVSQPNTGKTSVLLNMLAYNQRKFLSKAKDARPGMMIEVEQKYDPYYAKHTYGLIHGTVKDTKGYVVSQPLTAEEALNLLIDAAASGLFSIIGLDSLAALLPEKEDDGEVGKAMMMRQANLVTQALRKLAYYVRTNDCTVILVNQEITDGKDFRGNVRYKSKGAISVSYWSTIRLHLKNAGLIKKDNEAIGHKMRFTLKKNQSGPEQWKTCMMDFYYGEGFDLSLGVITKAIDIGICSKSGSWYTYGEMKIGNGLEQVRIFMKDNPQVLEKIREDTDCVLNPDNDQELSKPQDDGSFNEFGC